MSQKELRTRLKFWNWFDLAKVSYSSVSLVGSPDPQRPHYLKFSPSFFIQKLLRPIDQSVTELWKWLRNKSWQGSSKYCFGGISTRLGGQNAIGDLNLKVHRSNPPRLESFFQCCPLPPFPPTLRKTGCRVWPPLVLDDSKRLPLLNPAPLVIGLKVSYIEFDFGVKFSTLMYL